MADLLNKNSVLRKIVTNVSGVISLVILGIIVLLAIFAPVLYPDGPFEMVGNPFMPPFGEYLFGTDMLGRDIFSRLIWGAQTVVIYSTLATLTAYVFGLSLGLVAGYAGGRNDPPCAGGRGCAGWGRSRCEIRGVRGSDWLLNNPSRKAIA